MSLYFLYNNIRLTEVCARPGGCVGSVKLLQKSNTHIYIYTRFYGSLRFAVNLGVGVRYLKGSEHVCLRPPGSDEASIKIPRGQDTCDLSATGSDRLVSDAPSSLRLISNIPTAPPSAEPAKLTKHRTDQPVVGSFSHLYKLWLCILFRLASIMHSETQSAAPAYLAHRQTRQYLQPCLKNIFGS